MCQVNYLELIQVVDLWFIWVDELVFNQVDRIVDWPSRWLDARPSRSPQCLTSSPTCCWARSIDLGNSRVNNLMLDQVHRRGQGPSQRLGAGQVGQPRGYPNDLVHVQVDRLGEYLSHWLRAKPGWLVGVTTRHLSSDFVVYSCVRLCRVALVVFVVSS